jgi:ElaA protein
MDIRWTLKKFEELSVLELYKILQLRAEVFVVEQNCPYQDVDDKDLKSYHQMGWVGEDLAAYTRILPAAVSFDEMSIGRVVTSPQYRKKGLGKSLMEKSVDTAYTLFGKHPIRIGAQLYRKKFYEDLDFEKSSEMYLEDGIEHIEMLRM